MKRNRIGRKAVGAIGWIAWAATALGATTATSPVQVTILAPVAVATRQTLSFGEVLPPTSGAQTFTLDPVAGSVTAGEGDGHALGTPIRAEFRVTGTPDQALTVSASVTRDFGDPALNLSGLTTEGGTQLDGVGVADIRVGGALTVGATAAPTLHQDAVITITVGYP